MHLNGFAHRDFNHENVMIDEKGDVKVFHSGSGMHFDYVILDN